MVCIGLLDCRLYCYGTAGGSKIRTEIPGEYVEHCTGDTGHVWWDQCGMWRVSTVPGPVTGELLRTVNYDTSNQHDL